MMSLRDLKKTQGVFVKHKCPQYKGQFKDGHSNKTNISIPVERNDHLQYENSNIYYVFGSFKQYQFFFINRSNVKVKRLISTENPYHKDISNL